VWLRRVVLKGWGWNRGRIGLVGGSASLDPPYGVAMYGLGVAFTLTLHKKDGS
jgi:hypothetical protein